MVQEWAEMEDGVRRSNQHFEASSWTRAVSLSWRNRNAALGRSWSNRRQPNQHRQTLGPRVDVRPTSPPAGGGGIGRIRPIPNQPKLADKGTAPSKHAIFAPQSSLRFFGDCSPKKWPLRGNSDEA